MKVQCIVSKMKKGWEEKDRRRFEKARKRLLRFIRKESVRGLAYRDFEYENSTFPVIIEEVCEPDIQKDNLFEVSNLHEEIDEYYVEANSEEETQKRKVIFLMHGYNGETLDMKNYVHSIIMQNPTTHVYTCNKDSGSTSKSIAEIGKLIAKEIINELEKFECYSRIDSISFVGYSMGGLILRAALPMLEDYKKYFNGFLTFASPHIGYMTTQSQLLSVGMWVIGTLDSKSSVSELNFNDK